MGFTPTIGTVLFGVPLSFACFWEYRLYVEKKHLNTRKSQFVGDTPFYGKRWGYTTDYMIDQSLKTGDLVFLSYQPKGLHIHQAFFKFISSRFSQTIWDDVFMVVQKFGGQKFLVGLSATGGFELNLFSDKVANSFPFTVTVRRLQCSDEIRERLVTAVANINDDAESLRSSSLARTSAVYRRIQGSQDQDWDWCSNMIQLNRNIKILELNISRLQGLLKDFDEYMQTTKGASMNAADKALRDNVQSLLEEYQASSADLSSFYQSNPQLQVESSPQLDSVQQQQQAGPSSLSKILDLTVDGLNRLESLFKANDDVESKQNGDDDNAAALLVTKSRAFLLDKVSRAKSLCQKDPCSSAALTAAIYQSAGLLPMRPLSPLWTVEDFYASEDLLNPDAPAVERAGAAAAGPQLSKPFHVREESAREFSLQMAKWNKLFDIPGLPKMK